MGFPRQEYWSGLSFPSPGDLTSKLKGAFPDGSAVRNPSANAEDAGSIPGSGRSSGEGNGNPLQYSCLGNPMHRGAWWATIHGLQKKSRTQLSN